MAQHSVMAEHKTKGWLRTQMSSIRFWVFSLIGLLVLLIIYYIAADRATPFTSDAYVQAYVVQISPQVEGQVVQVHVQNGSQVKKGAPLYQVDARPYQHKVDNLRALLVQTQAEIKQLESQLDAQKAIIQQREADVHLANKTYDRISKLAQDSFAAQQQLDNVTDRVSTKKALLHEANSESEKLEQRLNAMIDGEHAEVRQVKAELAQAELRLSETTVYAPTDGIVDNLQLRVGTYVQIGEGVMSFVDTEKWWIVANYQENALSVIRPGQDVILGYFMYPGRQFTGTVESLGWGISQGQGLPTGDLPTIDSTSSWITFSQRFQVRIDPGQMPEAAPLRIGATVRTAVLTGDDWLMNGLARFLMWCAGILDFIY